MKKHLNIVIEVDESRVFVASVPQFKGCHSYGKTLSEALDNIREVVELCLEEAEISTLEKRPL